MERKGQKTQQMFWFGWLVGFVLFFQAEINTARCHINVRMTRSSREKNVCAGGKGKKRKKKERAGVMFFSR